jgi:hypothetical protein
MTRLALALALALVLASSALASASPPRRHCATPHRLAHQPLPALADREAAIAFAGPKTTRDGFGGGFYELASANFAVKWKDPSVTMAEAAIVSDALELAWAKFVGELGHRPCTGCDQFRLNAYISRDTDDPYIDFTGGYAWIDDDGYPYFVISRDIFTGPDAASTIRAVAVHEFYHDIQLSTGAFAWSVSPYLWFWEATAEWATQEALPALPDPFIYSGAYALKSELPLYYYGDPFGGDPVAGVHQYGASIFFRFVTDKLSAPAIIVNTWEQAAAEAEPLAVVASQLPGGDLPSLHAEFAARNAIWDHEFRDHVLASLALFKQFDPSLDEIAARVPASGIADTALARAPHGFGYAIVEVARPDSGRFAVQVTMTASPQATLAATVAYGVPGAATYTPLVFDGSTGTATVELPARIERAYLVIAPTTDERLTSAPIATRYTVTPLPALPEPEPEPETGGCCDAGTSGPLGALAPSVWALFALRRRRH